MGRLVDRRRARHRDGEYCYMRAPASEDATTTPLLRHMVARSLPAWPPAPSPLQANAVLSAPGTAGYVAISAMDGAMEDTDACMLRGRQRQNKRKRFSLSLSLPPTPGPAPRCDDKAEQSVASSSSELVESVAIGHRPSLWAMAAPAGEPCHWLRTVVENRIPPARSTLPF